MRCRRYFFLLVLLLMIICSAAGQRNKFPAQVFVRGFPDSVLNAGKIVYTVDSTGAFNFDEIRQRKFSAVDIPLNDFSDEFLHNILWLRFSIQNNSADTLQLFILTGTLDYTHAYFYSDGKLISEDKSGSLRPANIAKTYAEQTSLSLSLSLLPRQQGEVYIKIRQVAKDYMFDGIALLSRRQLNYEAGYGYYYYRFHGILELFFMGFVFCQTLYILMQWITLKRKEYQFYFFYLIALILFYMSFEEYYFGRIILFQRFPVLAVYVNVALQVLAYYLYYRFVWYFLDVAAVAPRLSKKMKLMEYFLLAYLVFDIVFIISTFDVALENRIFTVADILVFFTTAYFIIYLFRKHRNPLVYFILSGSLCVGIGNMLGEIFSTIEQSFHITVGTVNKLWYSQLGIMIEIVCFTAGLSYKNRKTEKDKIANQQKLIEQLEENHALQNKMQNIRNKIAQDLHDDVGSTLSTIILYGNAAKQKEDILSKQELMNFIRKIGDTSAQMIDEMSDIVWAVNPVNDNMEKIFNRMQNFASPLCSAGNIELNFFTDSSLNKESLLMDRRKNIYLIFKEAVNNAVKYACCSKLSVSIMRKENALEMTIEDNGKGFDMQQHAEGNGLTNMVQRASDMNAEIVLQSVIGKGTAVRLILHLQ